MIKLRIIGRIAARSIKATQAMAWLTLVLLIGSSQATAAITYHLTDLPSLQWGKHLMGDITLSAIGTNLDQTSVISWSFTITDSVGTPLGSMDSNHENANVGTFGFDATSTAITLRPGGLFALRASGISWYPNYTSIQYYNAYWNADPHTYMNYYRAFNLNMEPFWEIQPSPTTSTYAEGSTWVIASTTPVPEPSTLVLAMLVGAMGLSGAAIRTRTQATATHTPDDANL